MEGAARLEQIRASLGGGSTGAGGNQLEANAPKQVTGGSE
jgi:hypothetical protein